MAQTFTDLCRERLEANRGLHAFALGTFAETSAGIIRENATHMVMQNWNILRWVLVTAVVLLVPALAMLFRIGVPDPGSGTDGVNWGPMDFAIVGVLVLGAGLLYEYASRRAGNVAHKAAVGIAVAAGLFLIWVNLAVGMIGDEGHPANLMYVGVLAVALVGASIARFEPREASLAMFATAIAQALVALIALVAGLGPTLPADAFFVAAWVASALLLRSYDQLRAAGVTVFAGSVDAPAEAAPLQRHVGERITILCDVPTSLLDTIGVRDERGAPWYDRLLWGSTARHFRCRPRS